MRKIREVRIWYRFMRQRTRGLRRMCISLLGVMLVIARVVEKVVGLLQSIGPT